jgi:hypothetical protein
VLGDHGSDAGHTLEHIFLLTPERTVADRVIEVYLDALQFGLPPAKVGLNPFLYLAGSPTHSVCLSGQPVDELAAPGDQGPQGRGHLIQHRPQPRTPRFGKASQDLRIEDIGFRPLPGGVSEIAHLPGSGHRDWPFGCHQRPDRRSVDAPGGLQHNQRRSDHPQSLPPKS